MDESMGFWDSLITGITEFKVYEMFKLVSIAFTVLYSTYKIFQRITQAYRFNKLSLNGIYLSKRKYKSLYSRGEKTLYELIELKFGIFSSKGRPIYIYKDQKYKMKFNISKDHSNIINGTWKSLRDSKNYGSFGWNFADDYIEGYWSSATRDGDIAYGTWTLERIDNKLSDQLKKEMGIGARNKIRKWIRRLTEVRRAKRLQIYDLYDNILERHAQNPHQPFTFNSGNTYDILPNVFNPQFGKVGRPLIEFVLSNENLGSFDKILDWGTGCGYYMVEIQQSLQSLNPNYPNKLFALEVQHEAITCAQKNFGKFHCSDNIELHTGSRLSDVKEFKSLEFDLIIANLPFSRPEALVKHKDNSMYQCFCARPSLVFNLAFEIKNFLSINGKAYIAFANSGDMDFFYNCLSLVNLRFDEKLRIDETMGARDDLFYIYSLEHSKETSHNPR